jgi:hypothetical protein
MRRGPTASIINAKACMSLNCLRTRQKSKLNQTSGLVTITNTQATQFHLSANPAAYSPLVYYTDDNISLACDGHACRCFVVRQCRIDKNGFFAFDCDLPILLDRLEVRLAISSPQDS